MAEYVRMPKAHYEAACNSIRAKTGKADLIKSGVMSAEIDSITTGGSSDDVRYVTFMSYDGAVEYGKKAVAVGDDCADPIARGVFATPTRESDVQYDYSFYGWATTPNGAADDNWDKAVTEDRTVYANFAAVVRYYTITYYDSDGSTVLKTESRAYGSTLNYAPVKDGVSFGGWEPALATVTGDASYTVKWLDKITFAGGTWADIAEICAAGKAAETFAVGDTKYVNAMFGSVVILGFNHDYLASGDGKAAISLGLTSTTSDTVYVNTKTTSLWSTSDLRTKIAGYLDSFPADLKALVKPVTKITSYGSATETTTDSLWALSVTELGYSNKGEGSVYEYYGDSYSTYVKTGWDLGKEYWLRTLNASNRIWYYVDDGGTVSAPRSATYSCHFGFCI